MTYKLSSTNQDVLKTLIFLFAFVLNVSVGYAEIIDGPANLRDKPEGKVIITLNDGVEVEMLPPYLSGESWYTIGFVAYIEKAAFIDDAKNSRVKGQYSLYDKHGQVIGKTLETFKIGLGIGEENGRLGIVIENGYTYKANIKSDSIPEYELVNLLDTKESAIPMTEVQGFLVKYKFEKWRVLKDKEIEDYFIYESGIYDPSPMPRLQLIFYKSRLVSVIHRNLLVSKKYQSRELFRDMKIMNVTRIDADVSKRIQIGIIDPLKTAD